MICDDDSEHNLADYLANLTDSNTTLTIMCCDTGKKNDIFIFLHFLNFVWERISQPFHVSRNTHTQQLYWQSLLKGMWR